MKFNLYDEVRVAASARSQVEKDSLGVIVGIGEDEGSGWSYAVSFPPGDLSYSFWEWELEATGKQADPKQFAKHGTIRVRMDSKGRGRVVDSE